MPIRSVSQKRARRMYVDVQLASGVGRTGLCDTDALLALFAVTWREMRRRSGGLTDERGRHERHTPRPLLALERVVVLALRGVGKVDIVRLADLVQNALPELARGRPTFARIAEITERENDTVGRNRRPHDGGEIGVVDEVAVGR